MSTCSICGGETVLVDYPMPIEYHNEDTEWGIWPDGEDPGWLVAKLNTKPVASGCDKEINKGSDEEGDKMIRINCINYGDFCHCNHPKMKKVLWLFKRECIELHSMRDKCPLKTPYPKPDICSPKISHN